MSRPRTLPAPDAVLQRKTLELYEEEIGVEAKKKHKELNHNAIDERVTDGVVRFVGDNPIYLRVMAGKLTGRARGDARKAKGPQVAGAGDQLALCLRRDTLLPIDEEHSQFLDVLVKTKDQPRLGKAAAIYEAEVKKNLDASQVALAKARGIRGVAATVLAGKDVEWDEAEDEGTADVAAV